MTGRPQLVGERAHPFGQALGVVEQPNVGHRAPSVEIEGSRSHYAPRLARRPHPVRPHRWEAVEHQATAGPTYARRSDCIWACSRKTVDLRCANSQSDTALSGSRCAQRREDEAHAWMRSPAQLVRAAPDARISFRGQDDDQLLVWIFHEVGDPHLWSAQSWPSCGSPPAMRHWLIDVDDEPAYEQPRPSQRFAPLPEARIRGRREGRLPVNVTGD